MGDTPHISSWIGGQAAPEGGPTFTNRNPATGELLSRVEAASEALRGEMEAFGVQVGLIEPGAYKTQFTGVALDAVAIPEGSLYADRSRAFNAFIADAEGRGAGDPIVVARKLAKLCDVRRVPIRTLCGPDAWGLELARRIVPFGIRAWLTTWVFKHIVWKRR